LLRVFILLLLFNFTYGATAVMVHTDNNYKPYSYVEHGQVKGIHVEILKAIFSKMREYSLIIEPIDWEEGLQKMEEGEILMLNNLYYRPKERPYILDYSDAYAYDKLSFFCNRTLAIDNPREIDWVKSFKGFKIGMQNGFSLPLDVSFFKAVKEGKIRLLETTHEENIQNLIDKKIDCYINDAIATQASLLEQEHRFQESNKTTDGIKDISSVLTLSSEGLYFGFSKKYFAKRKDLIKKINLAIKVMRNSGEIDKIVQLFLDHYLTSTLSRPSIDATIYPLGSFVSDKMDSYGVLAEIVTTAFADRNISVNYQFRDRNQAYLYNKWGRTCMTFPWTKESDTWLYSELSEPIMVSDINFFYEKNHFPNGIQYDDLYDLKGYRLGGLKGAFYENFFSGMSFNYVAFENTKKLITALALKKIDVLPMNKNIFIDAVNAYMPHKLDEFAYHEKPMVKKANYILFSKKCRDAAFFVKEFNKGFQTIQQDGRFDQILEKYTTSDEEKAEFEKLFRNMKKVEKEEKNSVFDENTTENNATDSNITDLNLNDSNLTIEEANIAHAKKGEKKK